MKATASVRAGKGFKFDEVKEEIVPFVFFFFVTYIGVLRFCFASRINSILPTSENVSVARLATRTTRKKRLQATKRTRTRESQKSEVPKILQRKKRLVSNDDVISLGAAKAGKSLAEEEGREPTAEELQARRLFPFLFIPNLSLSFSLTLY